ncbi:hypothetical protein Dda_1646 [Drechslerella dactyloides]|uniref:Extracellular serine-rich protein n=1 Tax=Drechslerella dactyloides TaxID=74499 RepID=A0AAD6J3F8_DREDA|nr:hypothetical protein Dda_1646 [Drechslerella dactyloides]
MSYNHSEMVSALSSLFSGIFIAERQPTPTAAADTSTILALTDTFGGISSSTTVQIASAATTDGTSVSTVKSTVPASIVRRIAKPAPAVASASDFLASDDIPTISNQQPASSPVEPPPSAVPLVSSAVFAAASVVPMPPNGYTLLSNVLILALNAPTAKLAETPLESYGMSWDTIIVPEAGVDLLVLNATQSDGTIICNYNAIIIPSDLRYTDSDSGWRSGLSTDQWNALYTYQTMCNVRMVRLNAYPMSSEFGAESLGGCCNSGEEGQNVTIVASAAASRFATAGLKSVPVNLAGLWHNPAKITDTNSTQTTEFLQFSPNSEFADTTTGGVINTYPGGRSQMVFFVAFATWSATSTYLNHIWIHWATRGVYNGYRRARLSTQVDDVLLETDAWDTKTPYRTTVEDMNTHALWVADINKRLASTNPGSNYFVELGLNGNGSLFQAKALDPNGQKCNYNPTVYTRFPDITPPDFQKHLGKGTDIWPPVTNFTAYPPECFKLDPLAAWLSTAAPAQTAFSYVSHTFTHLNLNSATYNDTYKEVNWNLQYFNLIGLDKNSILSTKSVITPAVTGLRNGDALQAMWDNGVWNAVGDNTRPDLRNPNSFWWPMMTTVADNGFGGFQITPRLATRIYFNCDTTMCVVAEWLAPIYGQSVPPPEAQGSIDDILLLERESTLNHILSLMNDPFEFHQMNMRTSITNSVSVPGTSLSGPYSLLQLWTETQVAEYSRLVDWPLITLKQDDLATSFKNRYLRDQCNASIRQAVNNGEVTAVIVTADPNNSCEAEIPVTIPGGIKETGSNVRIEQIGNDPTTIWVKLGGSPVRLTLAKPISLTSL